MILNILQSKSEKEIIDTLGKYSPNDMLIESCKLGYFNGVQQALDRGADPTVDINYAIHLASRRGYTEIVKILLKDSRVDPSGKNNDAIQQASLWGNNR